MIEDNPLDVDRYADLKAFVAEWYRPIEPQEGYTEAEIMEAEGRLGFRLPEALRQAYSTFGKHEQLSGYQDYLNKLEELAPVAGVLPFFAENQGVAFCAIRSRDLADNDPIVVIDTEGEDFEEGFSEGSDDWTEISANVSEFLTSMAANNFFISVSDSKLPSAWISSTPIVDTIQKEGAILWVGTRDVFSNKYYRLHNLLVQVNGEANASVVATSEPELNRFLATVGGNWNIKQPR